jgi:hypothetical protein
MEVARRLAGAMAFLASSILAIPIAAPASPAGPSFTEAWYREVMLGDLAAAGVEYQRIYEGGGAAPARSRPDETRRRAALRAGGCFEKLSDSRRAEAAYSWIVRVGPPGDALVRAAELRLLELGAAAASTPAAVTPRGEPGASGEPAAPAPAASASPAAPAGELLERLRASIERREASAAELRAELLRRNAEAREAVRLQRSFLELGVEARLTGEPPPAEERSLAGLSLEAEDRELLKSELAERYYLRGLRALRDRNPDAAVRELKIALSLRQDFLDASELLRAAEGFLQPMEGIAERAALRLKERREARRLTGREALRAALASADRLVSQGRGPAAAQEVERARSGADWASDAVWEDAELRALVREADARALLGSVLSPPVPPKGAVVLSPPVPPKGAVVLSPPVPPGGATVFSPLSTVASPPGAPEGTKKGAVAPAHYEELRSRGRHAAEDLLQVAEDLIEARWVESDRRSVVLAGGRGKVEDDRADAARRIGMELERILVRGEDLYQKTPQDQSPDGWRRDFLDILILARWFPEADPGQRFRKLAQNYLAR